MEHQTVSSASLEALIAKLRGAPSRTSRQVGQNILAARLAARKSVDELAADAGIKSGLLGLIESGAQKPSGAELVAVAGALGVSVDRFFVGL